MVANEDRFDSVRFEMYNASWKKGPPSLHVKVREQVLPYQKYIHIIDIREKLLVAAVMTPEEDLRFWVSISL